MVAQAVRRKAVEAIDSDLMIRLDREEQDAELRYNAARERGDVEAMRVAGSEWTAAAKRATRYALEHVETYSD